MDEVTAFDQNAPHLWGSGWFGERRKPWGLASAASFSAAPPVLAAHPAPTHSPSTSHCRSLQAPSMHVSRLFQQPSQLHQHSHTLHQQLQKSADTHHASELSRMHVCFNVHLPAISCCRRLQAWSIEVSGPKHLPASAIMCMFVWAAHASGQVHHR